MDQLDPKLIEYIDKLAKAVGTTSEYLWGVLVKQGYLVLGKQLFYLLLVWPLATFLSIRYIKNEIKRAVHQAIENDYHRPDYREGIFVAAGVMLVATTTGGFAIISELVTPEMYALQRLMEIFK